MSNTNEQPTPETDAQTFWGRGASAAELQRSFARKLERERDAARVELTEGERCREILVNEKGVIASSLRQAESALREQAAQLATAKEQLREQPLAEMMSRGFKPLGSWAELNAYLLEKETALARCEERVKELEESLRDVLFAAQNADETGYVTDVGFIDLDAIHNRAHRLLKSAADRSAMATKEGAV